MRGRVLAIGGSDSGGGAGIQADIKTLTALGCYAATAITALTVQDTRAVYAVHRVPLDFLRDQIARALADPGADAIKTGMLCDAAAVDLVAEILELAPPPVALPQREGENGTPASRSATPHESPSPLVGGDGEGAKHRVGRLPLVVDPVMAATTGRDLLAPDALETMKRRLLPLATIITPNVLEAERLTGLRIVDRAGMRAAAQALLAFGPAAVLVKGGHLPGTTVLDLLVTREGEAAFEAPRIATRHTHGTGCTLASAIAAGLAQGMALADSVRRAHAYVRAAIASAPGFGAGHGPLDHAVTVAAESLLSRPPGQS